MTFYMLKFAPWIEPMAQFVFWYPLMMALLWVAGALLFSATRERERALDVNERGWPLISILIPCYNEEQTIEETITYLDLLTYPNLEIIAVNDGSTDNTGRILLELAERHERLRVIDCHENCGKANALHIAAHAAHAEYLLCLDSDAFLAEEAPYHLVRHFLENGERVGAVTGNPRIRNRDTLLSRIQIVEYASIIGSIKRTQRILGKIMTVSGVIVMFRKKALLSVDLWDRDMITEDIAVSWKLQRKFWDVRFEPKALCWMLAPETLTGLWRQRVRWSQGGQETIFRHFDIFKDWRQRRIWPVYIEQVISVLWAYAWLIVTLYLILTAETIQEMLIWFTYNSFVLVMISHIQLMISMWNDMRYDNVFRHYLWAAWYPAVYWMLNTFVVIAATPRAIRSTWKGGYATWNSPDRGTKHSS